ETEPLFTQSIMPDEATRIIAALEGQGIKATSVGDRLMVPSGDKLKAYSVLAYANALPRDGKDAFEDIVKNINPLQAESTTEKLWLHAREVALGQIITHFPGVESATVIIDNTHQVRIGGGEEPRAGITITTHSKGKPSQALVDAAASLVEGTQTNLAMSRIRVVIDGKAQRVTDPGSDDTNVNDAVDRAHAEEIKIEDRIKEFYREMPGLLVKVSINVNTTKSDQKKITYDAKNTLQKETESQNTNEQFAGPSAPAQEPGAVSNLGADATTNAKPGAAPMNTRDQTNTKYQNFPSYAETVSHSPAGDTTIVGATVRVPRNHFVDVFKAEHPETSPLSGSSLDQYVEQNLGEVKKQVANIAKLKETEVVVGDYVEIVPQLAVATAAPSAITAALTPHRIKEIVLAMMALVSLFMVSAVVKKSAPPAPVATVTPAGSGQEMLEASESPLGEAAISNASLEGMEMDEESIRAQQVVLQVTSLVKENPDSAASLVKRWLTRG
ncbi:MAG TPA: hypothetical protein VH370_07320, partial [Humisphaera sp.]|nr:hypothetical protein [Humisphaera sp.]